MRGRQIPRERGSTRNDNFLFAQKPSDLMALFPHEAITDNGHKEILNNVKTSAVTHPVFQISILSEIITVDTVLVLRLPKLLFRAGLLQ